MTAVRTRYSCLNLQLYRQAISCTANYRMYWFITPKFQWQAKLQGTMDYITQKTVFRTLCSLWPNDTVWWHRSGSTLLAWTNIDLLVNVNMVQWHSSDENFTMHTSAINAKCWLKNHFPRFDSVCRGQWVNANTTCCHPHYSYITPLYWVFNANWNALCVGWNNMTISFPMLID